MAAAKKKQKLSLPSGRQIEQREEKSKHLGHPASPGVRDNSSSVLSWGLLPPGTQTQQGLPLGNPCLVCFLEWGAAHVLKGRREEVFPLTVGASRGSVGKIRKRYGKALGQFNQSLLLPHPTLLPNLPNSICFCGQGAVFWPLGPPRPQGSESSERGDKT